jgi:hypothetical protein
VTAFDTVAGPEDSSADFAAFARFMRSLRATPVDGAAVVTSWTQHGSQLFDSMGCVVCSTTSAPATAEG